MPSKNPSKKALPLENLLRTLLRSVRLHDPLGVRPTVGVWTSVAKVLCEGRRQYMRALDWAKAGGVALA